MAFNDYYNEYLQDLYDPLGAANRQAQKKAAQQKPQLPDLTPQEETGLLQDVTGQVMSGLGYVGGALEKALGGRAIRGVLGGKPREALTVIPFSDTLGITDRKDRVSGKDLLQQAGLLQKNDDSWLGTGAGIATEIALDPALYLTFGGGALTEAGQVAAKAGLLPATIAGRAEGTLNAAIKALPAAEQAAATSNVGLNAGARAASMMDQPLGGLMGIGLPFSHPSVVLGQGQAGADLLRGVSSGVGSVLNKLPFAKPIGNALDAAGRTLTANFDPSVMGAVSRQGQEAGREASTFTRKLIEQSRSKVGDYATKLAQAGRTSADAGAELRMGLEGVASPLNPADQAIMGGLQGDYAAKLQRLQDLGINVGELQDDVVNFAPRQMSTLERGEMYGNAPQKALATRDPRIEGREAILKNIPGGTEAINRMGMSPELVGANKLNPLQGSQFVRENFLGWDPAMETERFTLNSAKNLTPADESRKLLLNQQYSQAEGLANFMGNVNPKVQQDQLRLFGNHPLADSMQYFERTARLEGAAEASHNLLAKTAIDTTATAAPQGSIPIRKVLEDAGLGTTPLNSLTGGQYTLLKKLEQGGLIPPGTTNLQELEKFVVPAETAADLGRYMRGFTVPESVTPVVKAWDYLTNLTKGYQTAVFPGFHVRNWMSGMWQNWVAGGLDPRFAGNPVQGFVQPLLDAKVLTEGGIIKGASQIPEFAAAGLDDAAATAQLGKEMFAFRAAGRGLAGTRDLVGSGASAEQGLGSLLNRIPGQNAETFAGAVGELGKGGSWNPLDIHGVGANADLFPPMRAGRQAGDLVEDLNRGSLFIALRRQGFNAEQAAMKVRAAHFDYQQLTPFERNVMRRVAPFYTWTRHNIPYQLEQLATRPGGAVGTAIKVGAGLRDEDTFVPPYLGGGLAVPLGDEANGTQRFLTRLDLPYEQAFEPFQGGPQGLEMTAQKLAGFLNPLIKAPVELVSGKQLYSGRDLADLYSPTGSTLAEELLMNSPASRLYTTGRQLIDPRKGVGVKALNLATGLKVSDVDVAKQRELAARELINQSLQGKPGIGHFESIYARPEELSNLSEADKKLLRLTKNLEQKQKAANKKPAGR